MPFFLPFSFPALPPSPLLFPPFRQWSCLAPPPFRPALESWLCLYSGLIKAWAVCVAGQAVCVFVCVCVCVCVCRAARSVLLVHVNRDSRSGYYTVVHWSTFIYSCQHLPN
jgi:hypothetical protein